MKIFIIGDIHGEFAYLNRIINKHKPDIVLACGDFGYWPNFRSQEIKNGNTKVYFCDGNHENHNALQKLLDADGYVPNEIQKDVFFMPRGTTLELEGKTFLFIGGGESIDKDYRIPGKTWFPEESITQQDIERLPDKKIDVVISHACPSFVFEHLDLLLMSEKGPFEQSPMKLNQVFDKYKPARWYFGHYHMEFRRLLDGCFFSGLDMLPNPGAWIELK